VEFSFIKKIYNKTIATAGARMLFWGWKCGLLWLLCHLSGTM